MKINLILYKPSNQYDLFNIYNPTELVHPRI